MRAVKIVFTLLAGTALALVSVVASSASAQGSTGGCPSTTANTICLTNSNNHESIAVAPGTMVDVYLMGSVVNGETWAWTVPASTNNAVLAFESGGTGANGNAFADFVARAGGAADIIAEESCTAAPGYACPQVLLQWSVAVSVVPPPSS